MKHPYLAEGQSINFVDSTGKTVKATITQVHNEDTARLEWENGKYAAVAPFSDKKEPNTFHFEQPASPKVESAVEAKK